MRYFVSLLLLGILALPVPVFAQSTENIVRDFERDIEGDPDRPFRVRLKPQKALTLGRMAGVWGSLGGPDSADSFLLGKTPDAARMRFDLTALPGGVGVKLFVSAKDGGNTERHEIAAAAGENKKVWLQLKGEIVVRAISADPNSMSADPNSVVTPYVNSANYALYFWYPGDKVDALSPAEFETVGTYQGRERPKMVRAVKGAAK